jgi:hypothetical protein
MAEKEEEWTTIRIKVNTRIRLEKYGEFRDSLDDVLSRILDMVEKKAR